jgi:Na+/H+-dicarboxylate symporter
MNKAGKYFGIPLAFWVIALLSAGLALGLFFPQDPLIQFLYLSGTYFPKTVVTLAAFIIFNLLAAAIAKLVLSSRYKAGRLFGLLLGLYVLMGLFSLLFVCLWIPFLTRVPFFHQGISGFVPGEWADQIVRTFSDILVGQPLLQALAGAIGIGFWTARIPALHPIARGLVKVGDLIVSVLFEKLLWYYPIMIGCLAIGIPMKFGSKGIAVYGQSVLWVALVTISWSGLLAIFSFLFTRRDLKQILLYFASVWPTGFGTGGSYNTLVVNIVSAEKDLGLRREIAETTIVFGTVLNRGCSTMSVLLVTITVARLLQIPLSFADIIMLIPPVLILGLQSPGIPGGAAFFMSPVVAVLLKAPDTEIFVTTFVTVFSGLIPMLNAAGNATSCGIAGAFLQDRFADGIALPDIRGSGSGKECVHET